ncbi:hypothetical protein ACP4OV_011978 [Aristida adscensionis]
MPPPPPPELGDDVAAEILLRLPPDEPACLFRAALVCKPRLPPPPRRAAPARPPPPPPASRRSRRPPLRPHHSGARLPPSGARAPPRLPPRPPPPPHAGAGDVIQLDTMVPIADPRNEGCVVGFAEGLGVIFVGTSVGVYATDLKSGRVRKVDGPGIGFDSSVLPYMSFYTPDRCGLSSLGRTN